MTDTMVLSAVWIFWCCALLLAYAHFGYPLMLVVIARLTRRVKKQSADTPSVTLLIPAHNEEKVLHAKLNNALALDYPAGKLEIVVASDGSGDRTVAIARSFADRGVRVLDFPQRRGKASALNDGVAAAKGDVVCLCDANVMFRPDALRVLVADLADSAVGAVSGDVRLASHESNFGQGESLYYRLERLVQVSESQVGSMMGVDGGMYVLRRELFQPLPPDTILDDFVVTVRVIQQGRRVVYEPDAVADENGTPAARQEFRRRVRVSAGGVQSLKRGEWPPLRRPVELWQYLSHKLLRWVAPFLLVGLVGANALLWTTGPLYQALLAAQIAFYVAAGLGALSISFRRTWLGAIPFYLGMSYAAMLVGAVKGILNRQAVTWTKAERTLLGNLAGGETRGLVNHGASHLGNGASPPLPATAGTTIPPGN